VLKRIYCLSNAMYSIGQSIKSPERPCVRVSVCPTFEAPYLLFCVRHQVDARLQWTTHRSGPPRVG